MTAKDKSGREALRLERIALGECEGTGTDAERAALSALQDDSQAILAELPPDEVVREVERRRRQLAAKGSEPKRSWVLPSLGALAAAAVLIVALPKLQEGTESPTGEGIGNPHLGPGTERSKGDERLLIQIQRNGETKELDSGAVAHEGDRLQLSYLAAEQRYGAILSVDGRGAITQHLPETGDEAVALTRTGRTALPSSYELDDAPHFERFYFISSDSPFSLGTIRSSIEKLQGAESATLHLPQGLSQKQFHVRKRPAAR